MLVLRRLGLPVDQPQALQACRFLIDKGYYKDGGINFWPSRKLSETCVTGMVLSILAYFQFTDDRLHNIPHHLIGQQMEDGGWNCESNKGANHSSFHTTINVLEGLWLYEKRYFSGSDRIRTSRQKAHQFLLTHRLFQSHRTGKVVDKRMTRFSFPPRWRYDLFRALDYFQECNALYDNRMGDAVAICRKRRRKDGTWPLQQRHPGKTWFEMEHTGQPSRWNTLRALRILNWVEGRQ